MTPGPPGYPYRPPPPHGYPYAPYGGPPPPPMARPTESRAILSLVLGILSLTCGGLLLGLPAVILGFSARKNIDRSGGAMTGGGLATGGIVTGFLGTFASLALGAFLTFAFVTGARAPHAASGGAHRASVGAVPVVELSPSGGPLTDQLRAEGVRARGAKKILIVETTASPCDACDEIEDALPDARMQRALDSVYLVRVDVAEFQNDLRVQKMWEGTVPWFYKVDSAARPTDAISADEWDENVPENIAPVLEKFAAGTLVTRRHSPPIGTQL
jgi:hypothetical protein